MATTVYTRQRGETIIISVADTGAVSGGESLVSAHIRQINGSLSTPVNPSQPVAASFVVTFKAADANFPIGWLLTLDATSCLALSAGNYKLDLKISDGLGGFIVTDPSYVVIQEPATL